MILSHVEPCDRVCPESFDGPVLSLSKDSGQARRRIQDDKVKPADEESGLDKFVVQVDGELEDLIPEYLQSRRSDIPQLRAALDRNDFDAITQLAHKFKGSGGGYGFTRLSELGRDIEQAGRVQDAPSVQKIIAELEHYLNHIEVVYK